MADQPYGRTGVVRDPFGHRWMVSAQSAAVPGTVGDGNRHGDIGYFTLAVPDAARGRALYGQLLGWDFSPGTVEEAFQIGGVTPMGGLWGGADRPAVTLCYQVEDVAAAVWQVRRLGGTAEEPAERPYGTLAECVDDQGTPFQLWQPPATPSA